MAPPRTAQGTDPGGSPGPHRARVRSVIRIFFYRNKVSAHTRPVPGAPGLPPGPEKIEAKAMGTKRTTTEGAASAAKAAPKRKIGVRPGIARARKAATVKAVRPSAS